MSSGPSVMSETQARKREACISLASDLDDVVKTFSTGIDDVAAKHGRSTQHVRTLAGIVSTKALKGPPKVFGVFCGKKLKEANEGKKAGEMITLPKLMTAHSAEVRAEFDTLSKEEKAAMLASHIEAKKDKENIPMRVSNIAVSKAVDAKLQLVTAICSDLNQMYQTETLVLFCRGNLANTYSCGSFATEGTKNWLENSDIGNTKLNLAAMQMEAFTIAGCNKRINLLNEGSAKLMYRKVRSECRNIIQTGLKNILRGKKYHKPDTQMNYIHYERLIVEKLGVALVGWPQGGRICNPGTLTSDGVILLRDALDSKTCKWVKLTAQQVDDRKAMNAQRAANGEDVYGPPRKKRVRKTGTTGGERNRDEDNDEMEVDGETSERTGK